jgi:hypothetical protein
LKINFEVSKALLMVLVISLSPEVMLKGVLITVEVLYPPQSTSYSDEL